MKTQLVVPFNLPLSPLRVKSFKELVNKDPREVEENRGENNLSTTKPLTVDRKQKVSF